MAAAAVDAGGDVSSCLDVCSRPPMGYTFLYCCSCYCGVNSLILKRGQKSCLPCDSIRARTWRGPGTDVHVVLEFSYPFFRLTLGSRNILKMEAYYLFFWQSGGGVELAAQLCHI